jgi:transcription antitermination factor NusG
MNTQQGKMKERESYAERSFPSNVSGRRVMTRKSEIPARYPDDRPLEEDLGSWGVLHVKPNCEKLVAGYLMSRNIGYYLPLCRKQSRVGYFKRFRIIEEPLFRGYLCFALPKKDHNLLYGSKKLVRIVDVDDQARFVNELQAVAKAVETGDDLLVEPGLVPGKKVLVLSGPLQGTHGTIVKRRKERQLALSVHMFNQTVLLKLDPGTKLEILG